MRRAALTARVGVAALLACVAATGAAPATAVTRAAAATGTPGGGAARPDPPAARRVLVLALPTLTWADLATVPTPNLDRLLSDAAVADVVVRAARRRSSLGNGYVTIGAGARGIGNDQIVGQALDATERFGEQTAADAFAQRTGRRLSRGIVHLGIARLAADNAATDFGATPGALGDALAAAGVLRAVIANADGTVPWTTVDAFPPYQRSAVTTLMRSDGTLSAGTVRPTLLEPAPTAPFGVRLSIPRVTEAFRQVWRDRSVVVVEASDLWRAWTATPLALPAQAQRQQQQALAHTDALVGALARLVDPRRDAVIVVGLAVPPAKPGLAVGAVRAPGLEPGLLRSATTRRSGFVHLVDVAPTVLALLDLPRPAGMEGRTMRVGRTGGSFQDRVRTLVEAADDSARRDTRVAPSITLFVVLVLVVAAAALAAERRVPRWRGVVAWASLAVLGLLVTPFVARGLRFDRWPDPAYWAVVVGGAACYGLLARAPARRRPADGLLVAVGGVVALHVVDVFTGARLELSTPFGYSPTVGIRMAGIGNVSFALTGAAALVCAGLIHARRPDRAGLALAGAVLAATLVSFTPPVFGQNFGATLAATPAFAITAWMLAGRSLRPRVVAGAAVLLVATGAAVAFLDYLRPADDRTHVGRFVEQAVEEGWPGITMVIERKGEASLSTAGGSVLLSFLLTAAVLIGVLALAGSRPLRRLAQHVRQATPVGVGLAVLGVLGFALNDSGIAIPAMVAAVTVASVSYLMSAGMSAGMSAREPVEAAVGTSSRVPAATLARPAPESGSAAGNQPGAGTPQEARNPARRRFGSS